MFNAYQPVRVTHYGAAKLPYGPYSDATTRQALQGVWSTQADHFREYRRMVSAQVAMAYRWQRFTNLDVLPGRWR